MPKTIAERLELPDNSFLAAYLSFAATLTDAPVEFHLGAGLTALSTSVGSRVIYPGFGGRWQWPTLYTLLIAPSGLYRKSTAVGIAEDIVQAADSDLILAGEQSREKFLGLLKLHPNVMYPISEFAALLTNWNRDYQQGFKEIIVDLFDCRQEYVRQTIKDGKVAIIKPSLNILAASTLDWLKDSLKEGDLRGGLMGRFLLFPGINKGEDPGLNIDMNKELKQWLVDFLKELSGLEGSLVVLGPVLEQYNAWYKKYEYRLTKNFDSELVGFQSRVAAHTLKLAVLLTISEDGPQTKYIMREETLSKAIVLGEWLSEQAITIARTGFTKSKTEIQIQKLLKLAIGEGVRRSEAMRVLHTTAREFDTLIQTAVERKEIRIIVKAVDNHKVTFYRAQCEGSGENREPG